MSLTNIQIGSWNVIGGRANYGVRSSSKIYFVDGDNGSDGNTGYDPENAVATIYRALTLANAWDVIYVFPKAWTLGNLWLGTAYQDTTNMTVTYAKQGLAMVGVSPQAVCGQAYSVVIKEVESSTAANLNVYAPMCAFENLAFERDGTETGGQLRFSNDDAGTYEANLGSVYNCHFYLGNGTTGSSYGGALIGWALWGLTVTACSFQDCRIGVGWSSSGPTAGNLTVKDCVFRSRYGSGSQIDADIAVYTQGSGHVTILNNYFAHYIPSLTAGAIKRWISVDSDRSGLVAGNHFGGAIGTTYTIGYGGTGVQLPTTVGIGANYCNGALMPVVAV